MSIGISFVRTFKSIWSLEAVTLPDFTMITGLNGSGKTHLLRALVEGSVITDVVPHQNSNNGGGVRYFDASNLVPQDVGFYTSDNLRQERLSLFQQLSSVRQNNNALEPIRNVLRTFPDKFSEEIRDPLPLLRGGLDYVVKKNLGIDISQFEAQLSGVIKSTEQISLQGLSEEVRSSIQGLSEELSIPVVALNEEEFFKSQKLGWGSANVFQHAFQRLFVAYRDEFLANEMVGYQKAKGRSQREPLNDNDFLSLFGPPPWDFVNKTLESAGLDFEINSPSIVGYEPFQPRLSKRGSQLPIPFADLSSGEKVLISLVFAVYYASDRRQSTQFPKVLLLDEVDAPLHPSMSKNFVNTIVSSLVNGFGIKVIATTHSPTTLALVPEEAVYVMNSAEGKLSKSTRNEALNLLTRGVPTLSLNFEGRWQVFVESPIDAEIYDSIFQTLKPKLQSERSLSFMSPGTGSVNSGCAIVKQIVEDLVKHGNKTAYGLIDWDGSAKPQGKVFVLGENERNGLENVVLDPLALAVLIYREFRTHTSSVGLNTDLTYIEFCTSDQATYQAAVDRIIEIVLKTKSKQDVIVEYASGLKLLGDKTFLAFDDHRLEDRIVEALPFFQEISKQQSGRLMRYICTNIFFDSPSFIPSVIIKSFVAILGDQPH